MIDRALLVAALLATVLLAGDGPRLGPEPQPRWFRDWLRDPGSAFHKPVISDHPAITLLGP